MSADTTGETRVPRTVLRDLVAVSAIPAALVGRAPTAVAAGLADVLIELLRLDFVFVRLCVPNAADAVDVARGTAWKTFPAWLESHRAESGRLSGIEIISGCRRCSRDMPRSCHSHRRQCRGRCRCRGYC